MAKQKNTEIFRPSKQRFWEGPVSAVSAAPPTDRTFGQEVSAYTQVLFSIHPTDPLMAAAPAGFASTVKVWRFKEEATAGAAPGQGQWYPGEILTSALDGNTAANGPCEYVVPTLQAERMYMELTAVTDNPALWTVTMALTVMRLRDDDVDNCCLASPATGGGTLVQVLAVHNDPVIAKGPQTMDEAKAFDGLALPNAVAEGDAVRSASTLVGARYAFLVNKDGAHTPIAGHGETIDAVKGGDWGVMEVDEAKAFDGAALPNPTGEGLAVRASATLSGVRYGFAVNKDGSGTPVAAHGVAITAADGGSVGNMPVLEAKNYDGVFIPNPVAEGQAVRPAGTLSGVSYIFPSTQDGAATPILREGLAISAANGGNAILMAGAEARNSLPAGETEGDGVRLITDLNKKLITFAAELASQSDRQQEIFSLNDKYVSEELVNNVAIVAATTLFYPSPTGAPIDSWKDLGFHIYTKGGLIDGAPVMVNVYLDGSSGMQIGGATYWDDGVGLPGISLGAYVCDLDQTIRALGETSLINSVGNTVNSRIIHAGSNGRDPNVRYWRLRVEWSAAPSVGTPGAIAIHARRKAL